jgi:CRP-like cAMP-binding protein
LIPALVKLDQHATLTEADRSAFLDLPVRCQTFKAGGYVARQGERVRSVGVVLSGFAYGSKVTSNGARQIISVHMPGDLISVQHAAFRKATSSIQMMTPGDVALISADDLDALVAERPDVQRAVWLSTLVDGSIASEWVVNVGRRDARSRIAHLLCEFATRLKAVRSDREIAYEFPMTQEQVGDATGLTSVHVNRTLQDLRRNGLIRHDNRTVTIADWKALTAVGDFQAEYLKQDDVQAETSRHRVEQTALSNGR